MVSADLITINYYSVIRVLCLTSVIRVLTWLARGPIELYIYLPMVVGARIGVCMRDPL